MALVKPASLLGVEFAGDVAAEVVCLAAGYPYFLQEYRRELWNAVESSPISTAGVEEVRDLIQEQLARTLVKEPKVLLADEPTGNLDEDTRNDIIAMLEQLWQERGLTMIMITHDAAIARRAQRIGVMTNETSLFDPIPVGTEADESGDLQHPHPGCAATERCPPTQSYSSTPGIRPTRGRGRLSPAQRRSA